MTQTPVQTSNGSRALPTTAFETAARPALVHLRGALADLLGSAPGGGARRPVDIQRFLKTDRTTSWRLHKIASARDPLGVGTHVPGPAAMQRVLKLASSRSVPPERIEAVRAAYRGVDEVIERFAGDRATFDSMVSGFAADEADTVDMAHRRAAFRGQSHIWGVQARVRMSTWIAHPNADDPALLDFVCLQGFYDVQRLRSGALLPGAFVRISHPEASDDVRRVEPIDADAGGVGFLGDFCGSPVPPMRMREQKDGWTVVEFLGDEIGAVGASTYLFGHVSRGGGPVYRADDWRTHRFGTFIRSPAASVTANLLLHADTFGRPEVTSFWLSALNNLDPNIPGPEERRPYELPIRDRGVYAGEGVAALHTTEMPRYSEMLAWALERLGWDPEGFHAYHLRAEYPPMPSRPVFEVPMPERRAEA